MPDTTKDGSETTIKICYGMVQWDKAISGWKISRYEAGAETRKSRHGRAEIKTK